VPIGDGYVNIPQLVKMLNDLNYQGLLAVELDFTHPEYAGQEDAAVEKSVKYLQKLVKEI
jgi:sugar phosphate isomerase/epimerase